MQLSWRGVNYLLLGTTAFSFAAEAHLIAFAPLQLRAFGLDDAAVATWSGLLFATTMATALPLGPFWGVLAERFSHRAILLRSQLVLAAALLLAAWAPDLSWLIVARALMGLSFGTGGVIVATQALLTPPQHVGRAIAVVQVAQPIAGSLGPPLGSLIIPRIDLRGLLLLDAGLLLAAAAITFLLLPEPVGGHKPPSVLRRTAEVFCLVWQAPPIRWSFINQVIYRGASGVVDSFLPVRIAQVAPDPATAIGLILGAYGALTTLVAWGFSRITDRLDVPRLYWFSMLLGTVLTAALIFAPWLWLVAGLAILRAIPTALTRPLLFMHLARVVQPRHQTGIFGLLPTAGNLGGLVLPLVAGGIAGLGIGAALAIGVLGHALAAAAGRRLRQNC